MRKRHRNYGWLGNYVNPYGVGAAGGMIVPTPYFQMDFFNSTIVPSIYSGTLPSFGRTGSKTYFDSPSTIATKTANNPQYNACLWGGTASFPGLYLDTGTDNNLLYSEDFSNAAWTDVGTVSVTTNTAAAPDGTTTADTITANANTSGKAQASGLAAASQYVVFSLFIKRVGVSDVSCTLQISGSGGTPETSTKAVTATTDWTRVFIYKAFTGSATGNVACQITIDSSGGEIYAWGAQLEQKVDTSANNVPEDYLSIPNHYVPTTAAAAISEVDNLTIPANNLTNVLPAGTMSIWVKSLFGYDELAANQSKFFYSFGSSLLLALTIQKTGANFFLDWYFSSTVILSYTWNTFAKDTYYFIVVAWDNSANPSPINAQMYIDGVQVATNTTTVRTSPTLTGTLNLANTWGATFNRQAGGAYFYRQFKVWSSKLTAAEILAEYNNTKATYGA